MIWIYLAFGVLADTLGMILGKKYVETEKELYFWSALTIYVLVSFIFLRALHHESLTIVNMLWVVGLLVTGTLAGQLIFRDQISTVQWIGITVCLVGVLLIQWPTK